MKKSWLNNFALLLVVATLAACGGGDGEGTAPGRTTGESDAGNGNTGGGNTGGGDTGGGNAGGGDTGGGNSANMLRGVASKGGPMAGVEIVAIEANSTRGARTTTLADGSFALNVEGLNRPLRLFASNKRAAESFALTNLVFNGQTVAHINEATHAITQAMGNTPSATRQEQFEQVLASSLRTYLGSNAGNFVDAPDYKADSTGADGVLSLVRVVFVGNGILLENRANPTQRALIDTTVSNPVPALVPLIASNQTIDPIQLRNLVQAFGAALAVQSVNPSKFDAVLHSDFVDNEGLDATKLAQASSLANIGVDRFEILRCYLDNSQLEDRCMVRVVLRSNAFEESDDFGNANFNQVELTDNYDIMVERRAGTPGLKIAGGQFYPFAAKTYLQYLAQTNVNANGNLSSTNPLRNDLVMNVSTSDNNQTVERALLRQTVGNNLNTLLELTKPGNGQCNGVVNLVRNPTGNADCSRQYTVSNLNTLEVDSRSGRINLEMRSSNRTAPYFFPLVRIKRGVSASDSNIPGLDASSLRALHAYGTGMTPPVALTIQLSPPLGFNSVCIATDLEESTEPVCVREARLITITNDLLPEQRPSYVLYTADNEGNQFVQRYTLQ